ncbi:MAG: sensor histidine kinase [Verrucomicrobiota bacterium]
MLPRLLLAAALMELLPGGVMGAAEPSSRPEPAAPAAQTIARPLTTTREVRHLPTDEARRQHPVKVRAMVTGFVLSDDPGYFVADATGPIFVMRNDQPQESRAPLRLGEILEIQGISDPGAYAPQIRERARTVVGQGELPAPRKLTFEQIATGQEDSELAEISGIVRGLTSRGFTLAIGEGRVDVGCSVYTPEELERLVDARVRLRGIVSGRFNQKRQWVAVRFTISRREDIIVDAPAPADPFAAPARSVGELLQWPLNQTGRHRVKVRGVVTHFQPGVALFVREGVTGLQIRTAQTQPLTPGDLVEVLGFPALETYSAVLEDAVFRTVGRGQPPLPSPTTPEPLLRGEGDANLVVVRGVLLESVRQQAARVLVMQAGEVIFHARLPFDSDQEPALPSAGSLLELAGICVVAETTIDGARLSPRMFSLLLRSPADITILKEPSWWTARRLWQALGITLLAALGILSWGWLLRRQVNEQTAALKDQTQREAILEERTRIAQELHDTLDQELTGISLQLNAATSQVHDDAVGQRLDVIQRLLKRSQSEVRRSVWDLRRPALESGGIAAALEQTSAQLRHDSTARLEVTTHGTVRPLPALVEHYLLRIATEATTNAFRHACATTIRVELFYEPHGVRLRVQDDGRGFVTDEAPGYAAGHFGLIGMRERSRKIGGTFVLESAPGQGTRVEISVQEPRLNDHASSSRKPSPLERS